VRTAAIVLLPTALLFQFFDRRLSEKCGQLGGLEQADGQAGKCPACSVLRMQRGGHAGQVWLVLSASVPKFDRRRLLERGKTSGRTDDNLETITKRSALSC
jgi:adenylate kinase